MKALRLLLGLLLFPSLAFAAARVASVTGNWDQTATWGGSSVPISGDTVNINGSIVVTVPAGYSAACAAVVVGNTNNSSGNCGLTINGTLTVDSGNSVKVGQGASRDANLVLGADGALVMTNASMYLNNAVVTSTATEGHRFNFTGSGAIETTGVTG